jgi:hypothetical protein
MTPDRPSCLDERAAALEIGVSVSTLRKWRHLNKGPNYVKHPGAIRANHGRAGRVVYRRADLLSYLDANLVVTEGP